MTPRMLVEGLLLLAALGVLTLLSNYLAGSILTTLTRRVGTLTP